MQRLAAVPPASHFDVAAIRRQVGEQVAEFERRLLVDLLAKQLHRLTLKELAEFINSPLGSKIGSLSVLRLLNPEPGVVGDSPALESSAAPGVPGRKADAMATSPAPSPVAEMPLTRAAASPAPVPVATSPAPSSVAEMPLTRAAVSAPGPIVAEEPLTRGAPSPPSPVVIAALDDAVDATDLAAAVLDVLAAASGPLPAAEIRRLLRCPETRLSEVLRTLRTEGAIEKLGVARGTRYALIPGEPQEPSPSESAPISPTSLSEFDAAVLEAVRLAGDWVTFPDLLKSLRCSEDGLRATLHRLVGQGKVRRSHTPHATIYKSRSLA